MENYGYIEYKYLPVTIKVCTLMLNANINYKAIFYLLQHQYSIYKVFSLRDEKGNSRGYNKTTSFKNCTTVDILMDNDDIVNIKIFKNKLLISGITNYKIAIDVGYLLLKEINNLKSLYNDYKNNINNENVINWLNDINKDYNDLNKIDSIINKIDYICDDNIDIIGISSSNVNHTFNLNMCISKKRLAIAFSKFPEFNVIYRNDINSGVILKCHYTLNDIEKLYIKRKCNTVSFNIYSTGNVTMTGPHRIQNEIFYNLFIKRFISIAKDVKIDKLLELKYHSYDEVIVSNKKSEIEYNIMKNDPFGLIYLQEKKTYV